MIALYSYKLVILRFCFPCNLTVIARGVLLVLCVRVNIY